jgi:hypothetical protein
LHLKRQYLENQNTEKEQKVFRVLPKCYLDIVTRNDQFSNVVTWKLNNLAEKVKHVLTLKDQLQGVDFNLLNFFLVPAVPKWSS